jgi:alkanesulfonate monooxygenase SsuD/methylene tetrahydromethanopterin reductase-like flavin-dependent oxidoreductase (luciferase family)
MRFGLDVPVSGEFADIEILSSLAVEAERAGWDGVFLQDTFSGELPGVDPWLALAVLATRTERVRLGVLMTPLSRRRPWTVARQAATIDRLSGGRMIAGFGLGAGEGDFIPFGEVWDPRTRAGMLDEGLKIVEGLWSGEPFTFTGRHYRLQDALLLPSPAQTPRIPMWVAGGWPRRAPLRRAARWDGLYLMTEH